MRGGEDRATAVADTAAASTQVSLLRRAFLPSPLEERPGAMSVAAFAGVRVWFVLSAIAVDIGIYLAFRGSPSFNQDALRYFALTNIPMLVLAGVLCLYALRRRGRFWMPLSILCITLEVLTSITWIQLTGTVSSYFLVIIPLIVLAYRLYAGYVLGLIAYAMGASMHLAAMLLEEVGVLEPAAIFVADPGGIYREPIFRASAACSIQFMFLGIFILANLVSRALREKELQLDNAQRQLDRVVAEVQPGRLSGQTLDGIYQLGELLGRGGMGEVYQATRAADGKAVAVKVLYAHLGTADHLARFQREAAIAAQLPPTHVAQVYDIGHESGHHYLVMELLQGEDLGTMLRRRGSLTPSELLPLIDQLVTALEAAHALGVVHRDLKPQNVFIVSTPDGPLVKLLDFGVARLVEGSDLTQTEMLIGSPGYLAPEQVATEFGEVSPQADVFALGAIIYRALTGHSAFPARNAAAAVYEAVHRDPPPPSDVEASLHDDVDDVIALALAKKPKQRYVTPTELARDLHLACNGQLGEVSRARARALDGRTSAPGLAPTLAASA